MKRRTVIESVRRIAKRKEVEFDLVEGGSHTKVLFNGRKVTTVPRHTEINEHTAAAIIEAAKTWEQQA